jgi:hypothetical protein
MVVKLWLLKVKITNATAAPAVYFFGDEYVHPSKLLQCLSTGHCSQCGRVENFLLNDILGIKKYFLAHLPAAELQAIKQKPRGGLYYCYKGTLFSFTLQNLIYDL